MRKTFRLTIFMTCSAVGATVEAVSSEATIHVQA